MNWKFWQSKEKIWKDEAYIPETTFVWNKTIYSTSNSELVDSFWVDGFRYWIFKTMAGNYFSLYMNSYEINYWVIQNIIDYLQRNERHETLINKFNAEFKVG